MSDLTLTPKELAALSEAVELWEKLAEVLGRIEAYPQERFHIKTEVEPGYLGSIGYDESGTITFQPGGAS